MITANTGRPGASASRCTDLAVRRATSVAPLQSSRTSACAPLSRDLRHLAGQHVERADLLRRLQRQHDVARADVGAHGRARGGVEPRHLQLAGRRGEAGELEGLVVVGHDGVEHAAAVAGIGERQDVEHRPDRRDLAVGQDHDGGREPRHLGDGMADIDDRHADLVAQPLDVGQDLGLALLVERGERLVHQQQARVGEQRAADRDALLLAARQRVGPALEQVRRCRAARRSSRSRRRRRPRRARTSGRRAGSAAR